VSSLKIMKEIADEKKNTDTYNWIGVWRTNVLTLSVLIWNKYNKSICVVIKIS
jgi:hypothetical protein